MHRGFAVLSMRTTSARRDGEAPAPRSAGTAQSLVAGTGMTTKVGGLTPSYARSKRPIKTGWAETDKGQPRKPNVRARSVAKEKKDPRKAKVVRLDTTAGGAETRAVRDRHGQS